MKLLITSINYYVSLKNWYPLVSCKRIQCEPTTCPNPIKGRCCNTCLEGQ